MLFSAVTWTVALAAQHDLLPVLPCSHSAGKKRHHSATHYLTHTHSLSLSLVHHATSTSPDHHKKSLKEVGKVVVLSDVFARNLLRGLDWSSLYRPKHLQHQSMRHSFTVFVAAKRALKKQTTYVQAMVCYVQTYVHIFN